MLLFAAALTLLGILLAFILATTAADQILPAPPDHYQHYRHRRHLNRHHGVVEI